jgi:hypothetical protein
MLKGVAMNHTQSIDFTLISRTAQIAGPGLLQPRNTALSWEFLKLQGVMPWNHAIGCACQFDHARLILDVGGSVRLGKRRAGLAFGKVAVEVAIV